MYRHDGREVTVWVYVTEQRNTNRKQIKGNQKKATGSSKCFSRSGQEQRKSLKRSHDCKDHDGNDEGVSTLGLGNAVQASGSHENLWCR